MQETAKIVHPIKPDPSAPLDCLVQSLLVCRGYGSLARVLDRETDPVGWAERLYDLAECTDCEDLLVAVALAYTDESRIERMRHLALDLQELDLALDRSKSVFILRALAGYTGEN
jgi:hypothetical protein